MDLQEGKTIVRIQGTNSLFDGQYAKLVKIYKDGNPEGNLGLTFGLECRYIFGARFKEEGITRFSESEVEVVADFPFRKDRTESASHASNSVAEKFMEDMGP